MLYPCQTEGDEVQSQKSKAVYMRAHSDIFICQNHNPALCVVQRDLIASCVLHI